MATRVYATARPTEQTFLAQIDGGWSHTTLGPHVYAGLIDWTYLATPDKSNGGQLRSGSSIGVNQHLTGVGPYDQTVMLRRWVLRPLAGAQTIGGTLQLCLGSVPDHQAVASNTTRWVVHVWLARYNATWRVWEKVATLLDMHENPTGFNNDFTFRFYGLDAPVNLTSVMAQAGDRPVIELGQHVVNPNVNPAAGADTRSLFVIAGTTDASNVAQLDAVAGNTNLTTAVGWFEFSDTLTFAAVSAPPVHDACADAKVIPSLPYVDGPEDVSESTDTDHAVWYQWTADDATPVMAAAFGSNYWSRIEVFSGSCAALGFVIANTSSFRFWLEMGQYVTNHWIPTPGTTYRIRVRNVEIQNAPSPSAGTLTFQLFKCLPPQDDDLYLDCQYILGVRGTDLFAIQRDFWGSTPTGNVIDYTRRPMGDVRTGLDHVGERLYIGFFGAGPLVEILDLPLLHQSGSSAEVNYFFNNAFDVGGVLASQNISTIVFDRSGRIVMGFYGDSYNYPPDGGLATPKTCAVRRMDGLNVNWPGPEIEAEYFEVEQDQSGTPSVELSSDQTTIFYTSAGRRILRYNLDTQTQLPDFATVPDTDGHGQGLRWIRLLPPGDGSGGLLVGDWTEVKRLNSSGVVIQAYRPADPYRFRDLTKVELTKAGDAFWVSDQLSSALVKFDLATGAELLTIDFDLPYGQLCGFAVYHGYRAGEAEEPPPPEPPEPPEPPVLPGHGCPDVFPIDPGGSGGGCPVSFFP